MDKFNQVPIEDIALALNAKKTRTGYIAKCPAHNDKKPSLSLSEKNEKMLFKCHAGCEYGEIIDALKEMGILNNEYDSGSYVSSREENSHNSLLEIESDLLDLSENGYSNKYLMSRGLDVLLANKSIKEIQSYKYLENIDGQWVESFHPCMVGIITNVLTNTIIGYHLTYLDFNGKKADLSCPKKIFGTYKNGVVPILAKASNEIILTEGIENAITISQRLDKTVLACLNANNLCLDLPKEASNRDIIIYVDKDISFVGERKSLEAKYFYESKGHKVTLIYPTESILKSSKGIDFNDLLNKNPTEFNKYFDGEEKEIEQYFQFLKNKLTKLQRLPSVIPFDYEILPQVLREYVKDCSERMSVPPDPIASTLLLSLSSMIGRRFCIQPKSEDTSWQLPPVLWGAIVSPSGAKKTPALAAGMKFLKQVQKDHIDSHKNLLQERLLEVQILEKNEQKLLKDLEKSPSCSLLKNELLEVRKDISELKKEPRRIITNDITTEKMITLHIENPNGITQERDELAGFINKFKQKGHEADREFYLEGFNGNGSYTKDTLSRGSNHVSGLAINIISATQIDTMKKIIRSAILNNNDGFIQRFQLMVYPDFPKRSIFINRKENIEANNAIMSLFKEIDSLEINTMTVVKFDRDAQERFAKYCQDLENRPYPLEILTSHAKKFDSLCAKLSLILHITEGSNSNLISLSTLEKAIMLSDYFMSHAYRIYSLGNTESNEVVSILVEKILNNEIFDGMTIRELVRKKWKGISKGPSLDKAIKQLEEDHLIRIKIEQNPRGGPRSKKIKINPLLNEYM